MFGPDTAPGGPQGGPWGPRGPPGALGAHGKLRLVSPRGVGRQETNDFSEFPGHLFWPLGPFLPLSKPRGPENRTPRVLLSTLSYFRPDPMGFDHFPSPFSF